MKAAVWHGPDDIRFEEIETPTPEPGKVLIKVHSVGICGTDLTIFKGKFPPHRAVPSMVLGHEFTGQIEALDQVPEETGLKPDQRVVVNPLIPCGSCIACRLGHHHVCQNLKILGVDMNGAFAEFITVNYWSIHTLPDDYPCNKAALIEPTAVAVHGVVRSGLRVGDNVVVLGAGPIGLLLAQVARLAGAGKLIVSEVLPERIKLARSLGLQVIDPSREDLIQTVNDLTEGSGADVVLEAAAVPQTAAALIPLLRPRGRAVIVGLFKELVAFDFQNINFKEAEIVGSRVYSDVDFAKAIELVISGRIEVEPLISVSLNLGQTAEGFKQFEAGKGTMKVIINPREH